MPKPVRPPSIPANPKAPRRPAPKASSAQREPARVKHFPTRALCRAGMPTLLTKSRATLACGCCCYVGTRLDNYEAATVVIPCSERHHPLARRFNALLVNSLEHPTDRPLVEVVAVLLSASAQ